MLLLSASTSLAAQSTPSARCRPDWSREELVDSGPRNAYHGDPFVQLRRAGVRATPDELVRVLTLDADVVMQLTALQALFECSFTEAREELEAFLESPGSVRIRDALTEVLLKWGSTKAAAYVRSIVATPSNPDGMRLAWYPRHIRYGGDCDLQFLEFVVASKDPGRRASTAQSVVRLLTRTEYEVPGAKLARKLLRDPDSSVRDRTRQALYEVAMEATRPELCRLLQEVAEQDPSADLRETAAEQLFRLRTMQRCGAPRR